MKNLFLAGLFVLSPVLARAQVLSVSSAHVAQGDTLVFTIGPQWRIPGVAVRIFDRTFEANKFGRIYVGVDPNTTPGEYRAFLVDSGTGTQTDFYNYQDIEVVQTDFPEKKFSFKAPRPASSVHRAREAAAIRAAYSPRNYYEDYASEGYSYPLETITVTGEFYSKRIYTDRTVPHRGVDLRAAKGTPVRAINNGKVVLAVRKFSLEGNAIIVDHGSGVFSVYLHLSKLEVREGQVVRPGQLIGFTGATGDARGPHLHFMVKVNGVAVDPLRFIEMANNNLIK